MNAQTVSLFGLNRLTASVGMAIKQKLPSLNVIGYDPRVGKNIGKAAVEIGAIDAVASSQRAAAKGDIIIFGYPLNETEALFADIGTEIETHAVMTDFGPLKRPVQAWADQYLVNGHFVAAMPVPNVAALEQNDRSVEAADPELFKESLFCIMPSTKVDQGAVETISGLGTVFGTDPYFIDMDEYDIYAQGLEILPTLVAGALFRGLRSQTGWGDLQKMAGFPFAQVTKPLDRDDRIAHMIAQNPNGMMHWLNLMIGQLEEIRGWVSTHDRDTLDGILSDISSDRELWQHAREQNDWSEVSTADVRQNLMNDMFLGGLGKRFRRED